MPNPIPTEGVSVSTAIRHALRTHIAMDDGLRFGPVAWQAKRVFAGPVQVVQNTLGLLVAFAVAQKHLGQAAGFVVLEWLFATGIDADNAGVLLLAKCIVRRPYLAFGAAEI